MDKWYVFDIAAPGDQCVAESFALKELGRMKSLPLNALEGYALAKSLRSVDLLGHVIKKPFLSDLVDHCLPSYKLKLALFNAFEQAKDSDRASLKPHEWGRSIYGQMTKDFVENFFGCCSELLINFHSYERQDHLNRFLHRRNLPAFDPGMKVDQYRKLFVEEILKILN